MKNVCKLALALAMSVSFQATGSDTPEGFQPKSDPQLESLLGLQNGRLFFDNNRGDVNAPPAIVPLRPAADYEDYEYLLMNADHFPTDNVQAKRTIVQNLPSSIKLIILAKPEQEAAARAEFEQWIPADRLTIATHSSAGAGFWSRDAFPYPTFSDTNGNVLLIGTRYFRREFTANAAVAGSVAMPLNQLRPYFVGGNLLADEWGQCFVIDSGRLYNLSAEQLRAMYGCAQTEFLPYLSGIGDVDEVLKILPGKKAVTQIPEIAARLREMGYEVSMLPRLTGSRTYANSVLLDGTIFVPGYGGPEDAIAKATYETFGLTVVMVDSVALSDRGSGSLHCITATYPKMPIATVLNGLGAVSN
jgi:hypothetical protein